MFALIMTLLVLEPYGPVTPTFQLAEGLHCSCVCIDGVVKTECSSIAAAKQGGAACAPALRCVVPGEDLHLGVPLNGESVPQRTGDCREVRVWRADRQEYDGVRVCDVRYGLRHNAPPFQVFGQTSGVHRGSSHPRQSQRDHPCLERRRCIGSFVMCA